MDLSKINDILKDQPKYRLTQIKKIVFQDLVDDWSKALTLPLDLREKLNDSCPLNIDSQIFSTPDHKIQKALITLSDGQKIEAVLISHQDRSTVCVSTQVGCPLGCSFCATGQMGFVRNLTSWEIVSQVILFSRLLQKNHQKITNVVYMGMGEPFLNYDHFLDSVKILNDREGLNLGQRHISVSTCGITTGIDKLASSGLEINLAVSLHAPKDLLRSQIMKINNQYPIKQILSSVDHYLKITHRKVMFEYLLLDNINDFPKQAFELADLLKSRLCMVNLISYHQTGVYQPSSKAKMVKFQNLLLRQGLEVTIRESFGENIQAACGQLAIKHTVITSRV